MSATSRRPEFFNPRFHERCPSGHVYSKSDPQITQCPICYTPKTKDECGSCGHTERSHSPHSRACLWTNCKCKAFKAFKPNK
jgi:hypothetical protein